MLNSNQKAVGISAVMSNPKLSALMSEAMKAPFGSSKRERAVSVLKSLVNRNNVMDGQGGSPDNPYGLVNPYQQANLKQQGFSSATQTKQNTPTVSAPQLQQNIVEDNKPDTTPKIFFKAAPVLEKPIDTPAYTGETTIKEGDTRINPVTQKEEVYTPTGTWDTTNGVVDNWYKGLSLEEQKQQAPLYEAYKLQVGPKTATMKIMSNKEEFKSLFPGIPEEQLPIGSTLSEQLSDIKSQLKKEYELDEKAQKLQDMQTTGITIEKDLQGYITTRDKYVEKLDNMIDNFHQTRVTMDMSNPYTAKIADNYLNYLYVLKGRQQKRYADFLSDGVKYYEAKVKSAEDTYNTLKDKFNEELSSKEKIKTEDFKIFSNLIEEMYDNINNKEKNELDKLKYQQDLNDVNKKIVEDTTGLTNSFNDSIKWGINELQQGSTWEQVFDVVKSQNPKVSNKEIYRLLNKEFWSKPNAYQEWTKSKKVKTTSDNIFSSLPKPVTE